jgi:hypothetical protein
MPKLINGKIVLLAIGLSSLTVSGVSAMYYINIFSSATDASREASATVFAGLSEVMAALSAIERSGEMSAGSDALGAAEAFLLAAQKGFTALVDSDVSQQFVTLDGLSDEEQAYLVAQMGELGVGTPQTVGDILRMSERSLERVIAALGAFRKQADIEAYAGLRAQMSNALFLGQLGSQVLMTAK